MVGRESRWSLNRALAGSRATRPVQWVAIMMGLALTLWVGCNVASFGVLQAMATRLRLRPATGCPGTWSVKAEAEPVLVGWYGGATAGSQVFEEGRR